MNLIDYLDSLCMHHVSRNEVACLILHIRLLRHYELLATSRLGSRNIVRKLRRRDVSILEDTQRCSKMDLVLDEGTAFNHLQYSHQEALSWRRVQVLFLKSVVE